MLVAVRFTTHHGCVLFAENREFALEPVASFGGGVLPTGTKSAGFNFTLLGPFADVITQSFLLGT